jgi:hypothetical protein
MSRQSRHPAGSADVGLLCNQSFRSPFTEPIAEALNGADVSETARCPGTTASEFRRRAGIENVKLVKNKSMGMMSSGN